MEDSGVVKSNSKIHSKSDSTKLQSSSNLIFEYEDVIKVFYDEDNGLIIHEWLEYNPDGQDALVVEILQRIYETLRDTGVRKVLVIVDKTRGVFSPEINKYIRDVQFPRLLKDTNIKFVATVTDNKVINSRYAEIWKVQLKRNSPVILHDVSSEAEGRFWLKQFD